ncbi:30S ribosomal protein S8 [bacterium]|nr:30S ribosomal protein S8 [bacterium]
MLDPIVDLLNRIRNAQAVRHQMVEIPFSKMKLKIVEILAEKGFIGSVRVKKKRGKKIISIILKYNEMGLPQISGLKRISKSGQRVYKKSEELQKVRGGYGLLIVSTPKGLMTGQEARKKRLGGEIICEVW